MEKNEVEEVAHEALLLTFAREFVHFFALILWIAAGLAFFAEWRDPGQGMATLGFAIVGVILINGVFSFWQACREEEALAVLKKLLPSATKVLRAGTVRQLSAAELVPVHAAPEGKVLYCKGAAEVVLPRCTHVAMDGGTVALADELATGDHG